MSNSTRSATEVLVECMEQFSACEVRGVLVVFTDEADSIVIMSNLNRGEALGFMELARDMILRKRGDNATG